MAGPSLLIGWGNPLRQDDGLGWHLARQLQAQAAEGSCIRAEHQLLPELSHDLARCGRVLFVDALHPGAGALLAPRLEALLPAQRAGGSGGSHGSSGSSGISHHQSATGLLQLCLALYGHQPPASLLLIPAPHLGFADQLSAAGQRQLQAALPLAIRWLNAKPQALAQQADHQEAVRDA